MIFVILYSMSSTSARILQYIAIILVLAAVSGAGYALYQSRAAVTQKSASEDGLVGYWRFEENTGTAAGDMSGSGNTGTLTNGPTWVDGRYGKGINFDGTNDYVSVGSPASLDDIATLTTCAWIYPETLPADGAYRVIDEKTSGTGGWAFIAYNSGGTLYPGLYRDFSTYDGYWFGTQGITLNVWTHVCLTYDNSSVSNDPVFYIGGASMGATEIYTPIGTANSDAPSTLAIGAYTSAYYFDGAIDEVRIYNRILMASEISAVYGSGVAKMGTSQSGALTNGLVGLWSFNGADISGTTAYDRSVNTNNGTLTGGPVATKGRIGQGVDFDGVDDEIWVADPGVGSVFDFANGSSITLSAWVNPSAFDSTWGSVITKEVSGGLYSANYAIFHPSCSGSSCQIIFYYDAGSCNTTADQMFTTTTAALIANTWQHIAVTYTFGTANSIKVYVNGTDAAGTWTTGSGSVAPCQGTENLRIGQNSDGDTFDGRIDDVRIYNRSLSSDEIWGLYQLGESDVVNAADSQGDSLQRGLRAYWKLDENTGTSTADASTSGSTGTLTNGPTWTTGRIGSGVTLDGTNDYIETANVADNLSSFSVSAWFKIPTNCTTTHCPLVSKVANLAGGDVGWALVANGASKGQLFFLTHGPTINDYNGRYTSATFSDGNWHHALVTHDNGTIVMYVDGMLRTDMIDTAAGTPGSFSNSNNVRIGTDYDGNYYQGSVDEVRIYDRTLSAEEAAKLYKTTIPNDPDTGLGVYYPFNGPDISGTTVYDRSGAGKHATLTYGPVPAIGKIGQGVSFDGTDDFIEIANSVGITGSRTVSFWMKPDVVDANNRRVFYSADSTTSDFMVVIFSDGFLYVTTDDVYSPIQRQTTSAFSVGQWHHIAITKTTNNINEIYVDGAAAGTVMSDYTTAGDGTVTEIGGSVYTDDFDGTMDDVRVYSRVLTATEILDLYNKGR